MKKIIEIESNIKSQDGTPWSYEIDDNTLLIGPNECGKSAISEAIQLALTGSVSGILLKAEVKSGSDLECLIPDSCEEGFARVTFSDGSTASWEKKRGKAVSKSGQNGVAFPVNALRGLFQGSEEKVTKTLFEHFSPTVTLGQFKDLIPAGAVLPRGEFEELLPDLGRELGNESVLAAADYIDMMEDAAKISREEKAKSRFLKKASEQFSVSSPKSDDLIGLWEELALAIRYETMKKMYVNADYEIRDSFMLGFLRELGDPKDLKELRGSAIIHDEITDTLNGRALYDYTKKLREDSISSATLSKNMAAVSKAMMGSVRVLTVKYLEKFTSRVNDYLPEEDRFFMEITPSKFIYGLHRGSDRHRALSGSTEARVLAAMASAFTKPNEPAMVIVDDRMWDTGTLSKTMAALEDSPCQVIMMTTMKPRGRKRAGWEYIEVGTEAENSDEP